MDLEEAALHGDDHIVAHIHLVHSPTSLHCLQAQKCVAASSTQLPHNNCSLKGAKSKQICLAVIASDLSSFCRIRWHLQLLPPARAIPPSGSQTDAPLEVLCPSTQGIQLAACILLNFLIVNIIVLLSQIIPASLLADAEPDTLKVESRPPS